MWVLEGLSGIQQVNMDLERDSFTISYIPTRVNVEAIMARIRLLGFRPEPIADPAPSPPRQAGSGTALTEPVKAALDRARGENRLLLIDFFAEWCGPCITLEKEVLVDTRVAAVLQRFHLLKIDTDRDLESARRFRVVALPTLVVLDGEGNEIYRHEGTIEAAEMAKALPGVGNSEKPVQAEEK